MAVAELLIERGLVTEEQLKAAEAARNGAEERVDEVLVRTGVVSERDVLLALSEQLRMPLLELSPTDIDPKLLSLVPSQLVHKHNLVPVARRGKVLQIATSNPHNIYALDEVAASCTDCRVEPVLATQADINKVIKAHYGVGGDVLDRMITETDDLEIDAAEVDSSDLDVQMAQEATVIKLVNEILVEAIAQRASDIHFEPFETDFIVRYRVDGVLHSANVPPEIRRFQNAVISRLKILSGMNIAEKRLPQDGGFKIKTHGREIDLRVSVIPMAFGEGVVLRILDRTAIALDLPQLGMEGETLEIFSDLIRRPHGIILVTGPTGSGKTTTLYASLGSIVDGEKKILTIEDPIEYYLEGVNQVQTLSRVGLDFARAMRAFLRHDPDVILVGEIRDRETAETAINASLTGHLVFSTLHTNDSISAATRLINMGVEPFLVSSSVEAVLAQRLARKICKNCKEEYVPESPETLPAEFGYRKGEKLWRGAGCRECLNTGYAGRRALYELLVMTDELREMIVNRRSAAEMLSVARKGGLKLLSEDGWGAVRQGVTTPEEVLRVTKV